jgi:hypothetical protein
MPIRNKIALVSPGDREARNGATLEDHRLKLVAQALRAVGLVPELAIYHDDFSQEVFKQLIGVDAVLVWVNPIEGGRDRTKLDAMLERVAESGVLVSAHPRTIQKMGTKAVLVQTRDMSWGSDVHLYSTMQELRNQLPVRLVEGKPRVLKQLRGHSGHGVWKVAPHPGEPSRVKARHAARGSVEQEMPIEEFFAICEPYLADWGRVIDQAYQERLTDGMVRCYLVGNRVAGFGRQEINALFPAPEGASADEALQPGPRLYHPSTKPEFQGIRHRMETEWLPEMLRSLSMDAQELPLLWDADFFFGPKDASGEDTFVLGEINVSSVYPFPDDALVPLAETLKNRLARQSGHETHPS